MNQPRLMPLPKLSGRQVEVFSLLYATPAPLCVISRRLGIARAQLEVILNRLMFLDLVRVGTLAGRKVYAPADWTQT